MILEQKCAKCDTHFILEWDYNVIIDQNVQYLRCLCK